MALRELRQPRQPENTRPGSLPKALFTVLAGLAVGPVDPTPSCPTSPMERDRWVLRLHLPHDSCWQRISSPLTLAPDLQECKVDLALMVYAGPIRGQEVRMWLGT
jgi:hypothetical protein